VPVVAGLFWQGSWTMPVSQSDDFKSHHVFANNQIQRQVQQSLLTWVAQPLAQTFVQASTGYINSSERGGQLDVAWLSQDARLKLQGTAGSFSKQRYSLYKHEPRYAQARYELVPGLWAMQLTAGEFFSGDKGWQLSSQHWFSSYRLALHYRKSESAAAGMPLTKFAGFTISLPIGPERSTQWSSLSLRGRDLWSTGLESKVGARDNYLTGGYGVMTSVRHGLNDMLDYDRRLPLDSPEGRRRLEQALAH